MILGRDALLELQMDICLSNYTISGNGDTHEVCMTPMKGINKFYVRITTKQLDDKIFRNA